MYSPNGTLDTGLLLYVLGGLSKSRNGVAQSFFVKHAGFVAKTRSLLAAAHSRGPAGIPGYSGWAHGIPGYPWWTPGPKGPELKSQSIHGGPIEPRRPELGSRGTQETHWTQRPQRWIPGYLRSAHGTETPRGPRRVKPRVHRLGLNSNEIEA